MLVLAFIGDDEPGLVHALAEVLSDHGGHWGSSRMARIGHLFTGAVQVSVEADRAEALVEDFRALEGMLQVIVRATSEGQDDRPTRVVTLDVVGPDRPGIVEHVSAAVARPRINVRRFSSGTSDDPDPRRTFHVRAVMDVHPDADLTALEHDLRGEAEDLSVRFDVRAGSHPLDDPRS